MFVYNSQETSETLFFFFPPLFLVLSADQIPDSATVADPNRGHAGHINSPYKTCGRMALHWLYFVIPARSGPKAVSVQHQTTAEKHPSTNIIFLILSSLSYKDKDDPSDECPHGKSCIC